MKSSFKYTLFLIISCDIKFLSNLLFISVFKSHPDFDEKHCCPFVCDISADEWTVPFEENSLDYIILIFVLSAIHPEK